MQLLEAEGDVRGPRIRAAASGAAVAPRAPSAAGSTGRPAEDNQDGCSEAAKLVYVVSDSNALYSFAPTP